MARLRNRKEQVIRIFTNGKRANDSFGLERIVGRLVKAADTAVKRAQVSTARATVPIAKREVVAAFNIQANKVNDAFKVVTTKDTIRLFASDRRIAAIDFGGVWGGIQSSGATAVIERGGAPQIFRGAFINTVKGRRSIRERKIKGGKRAPRGPLIIIRGPSPKEMMIGLKTDQRRNFIGSYRTEPRRAVVAQMREIYIRELRRQYLGEALRGR